MTNRCLTLAALVTLPIFSAGCGKQAMVPVQGKVTYRGVPSIMALSFSRPNSAGRSPWDSSATTAQLRPCDRGPPRAVPPALTRSPSARSRRGRRFAETGGRFDVPQSVLPARFREFDRDPMRIARVDIDANRPNFIPLDLPSD